MATVTTSGIWTSINPDVINKQGLGTNHASWGTPAPLGFNKPSSYQFDGVTGVQANLDGTEFKLGTFTHHNFPLNYMTTLKFGVNLKVTVTFDGGLTKEFNYTFAHYETPATGQADEVSFPNTQSTETVTLDGSEYKLTITGFKQSGNLVSKFISPEARSNSADIFAKLELIKKVEPPKPPEKKEPLPEKKEPLPVKKEPLPEEECKVKAVVNTSSLLAVTLERLNNRSVMHLIEQIIAEVNDHCEKKVGPNINITEVLQQIEQLNLKLQIIQKAAQELDRGELGQIEALLKKLLLNMNLGDVIQNLHINVDGRSFNLQSLLQVISTVDQVVNIQIQYTSPSRGDVAGAIFILTDQTQIVFKVRTVTQQAPDRLIYIFETASWKGLPAQFSLVFNRQTTSYKICNRTVSFESFDAVEQTSVVFDLCPQIAKLTATRIIPPPPFETKSELIPPPPFETKSELIPPPPFEQKPTAPPAPDFEAASRAPESAMVPAKDMQGLAGKLIRLKSWKGDYLHRPDRPQEVTTWGTGIGNVWYVEVLGDKKVRLRSWKGDFLQRAEGAQGATSGGDGEWTVEFDGGKLKLKSSRGDYLHRPDTPHGVTTWSTGIGNEWTAEIISDPK